MNNYEKVQLLNTLHNKVTDWESDGSCCIVYVFVTLDDETRKVLNKLGFDDDYINANDDDGEIDITPIGFSLTDWWDSEEGFSLRGIKEESVR
jgi:hypothetical protein